MTQRHSESSCRFSAPTRDEKGGVILSVAKDLLPRQFSLRRRSRWTTREILHYVQNDQTSLAGIGDASVQSFSWQPVEESLVRGGSVHR